MSSHKPTPSTSISPARPAQADSPAVDEAERKVGAVLAELESDTGGEVQDIGLDDLVDTDSQGRPVLKKGVDIELHNRPARTWQR